MSVIFWVFTMVPMVVLRRGKDVFDETKVDTCIGMDKHGMYRDKYNVNVKHRRGEA